MEPRPEDLVTVPAALARLRRHALDGALLLFDRDTGLSALCDGPEVAHLRRRAPRVVQLGITNVCNLACTFCCRELDAASAWTVESALAMLADLARAGVLEVAFGGGEPFAFRGIEALAQRLHAETPLALSFTTNGLLLTRARLRAIAGTYGQIRVSAYDDNDWEKSIALLADERARFGLNWLVTPERLPWLERVVLRAVDLGCTDILLLSYNGRDVAQHLTALQSRDLARRVGALARGLGRRAVVKLSVCWGERLDAVPRLFSGDDCGAGLDFVVLTSDRRVQPCSFHERAFPVQTAADVIAVWERERASLAAPAQIPGCARLPAHGLGARLPVL
ncbi:Coenzyme PQQ synthesis protein E [Minicystis rosea]|nr:Coenzyme PQQ synthesis protein E [Minicystis rosea]